MRLFYYISLCVLFYLPPTSADTLKQLYRAEVDVSSRSVDDRNAAIQDAMKVVLSKMVLEADLSSHPAITTLLNSASRFVQTYQFKNIAETGNNTDTVKRRLQVVFNGDSIRRLLQNEGIAVWGRNRPSILIWLVVEQNGIHRLFQPEQMVTLNKSLVKTAKNQGLSLTLPLIDLTDQGKLSAGDLWAGFDERVIEASNRYAADLVLTGRLAQKTKKNWDSHWRLYSSNNVSKWGQDGIQGLDATLRDGLEAVFTRLFPSYATRGIREVDAGVQLSVAGVSLLTDFVRVVRHIEAFNQVEKVEWSKLESTTVIFKLHLKNDLDSLKQALATSDLLDNDFLAEQQSGLLQYRIQP